MHAIDRAVAWARLLFDHLVRAQQNRWWYGKPERRGGLAVHDHLKLGRKLHREIAQLLSAQDAIHKVANPRPWICVYWIIAIVARSSSSRPCAG